MKASPRMKSPSEHKKGEMPSKRQRQKPPLCHDFHVKVPDLVTDPGLKVFRHHSFNPQCSWVRALRHFLQCKTFHSVALV